MIASIRGEVLQAGAGWVVVALGGVGFRVEVPARLQGAHLGAQLALHTQLIVREDSLTLYGFSTVDELDVFNLLLGVSGVGPRSALGVLSELTPSQVAQAAALEDEKPFRKVSGIGPKTAKLIAVQLSGKLQANAFGGGADATLEAGASVGAPDQRVAANVVQALVGLGYTESQADAAVDDARTAGVDANESDLLRASLALLQAPRVGAR